MNFSRNYFLGQKGSAEEILDSGVQLFVGRLDDEVSYNIRCEQ